MRRERGDNLNYRLKFLILGVVILGGIIVISLWQFQLKKIVVIAPTLDNIRLEIFNNKNLLFLNIDEIKQSLLAENIDIKSLSVYKKYPQTIIINFILREPKVILNSPRGSKLLSDDGIILSQKIDYNQNLPVIESSLNIDRNNDWRILKMLSYLKLLSKKSISVNKIIQDDDLSVFKILLDDNTEIIVPQSADPTIVSPSLQLIIYRFRIEGKFISKIDFSYDKPVVSFINGEKNISP